MSENPFDEVDELIERMNNQFGELSRAFEPGVDPIVNSTAVDVADTGEEIVVTADLPGVAEAEIDLRAETDSLTISAETTAEHEIDDADYHRKERSRQSVSRRVSLPVAVDAEEATASYTNGVLTVTLPKRDQHSGYEIDVE